MKCCDTAMPAWPSIAALLMQLLRAPWTGAISLPHKCRSKLIIVPERMKKDGVNHATNWS